MEDKHKYGRKVEEHLAKVCLDEELFTAESNDARDLSDFESMVDMIECERAEKEYEWHSDVFLPEYPSIYLTQASLDAATYFQTRDYVDAYLQDGSPEARAKAEAAKECINRTLNQKHLHHFQKYMRSQAVRRLYKNVVLRCWWEREDRESVTGFRTNYVDDDVDVFGAPITDMSVQVPAKKEVREPVVEPVPVVDRFNYDVVDPRNVFISDEYTYTLQTKRYVYLRYERTLEELKAEADRYGYINLDILGKVDPPAETDTSSASFNKDNEDNKPPRSKGAPYDVIEGYKKDWVIVTERAPVTGEPLKAEPGYDEYGKIKNKAELQEVIVAFAKSGSQRVLIRYHLTPYVDTTGVPFRPLIRGLCYIHPTKDGGIGDGKIAKEIQKAINDTFNVSNDRVLLATLPTLIANKYAAEDNDTIRIEPEHVIEVFNPKEDLQEFKISDDISGAMAQIAMLKNNLQQALAVYPTTMGNVGDIAASTTATAVVGAEQRTNARTHYTSLTAEYTMLCELYWMILQMTGKFAHDTTGVKLMGDKLEWFDPNADYVYKPLTQAIETETSKQNKIKNLISMLGYLVQLQNPMLVNAILKRIFETMGDEYEDFARALFAAGQPMQPVETMGVEGGSPPAMPTSNQNAMPMSAMESMIRMGVSQ